MLSSSFPHLFFIVIVAKQKLWDFLPLFPRTELQLQLRREEDQLCRGTELRAAYRCSKKTKGASQREGSQTANISAPVIFPYFKAEARFESALMTVLKKYKGRVIMTREEENSSWGILFCYDLVRVLSNKPQVSTS